MLCFIDGRILTKVDRLVLPDSRDNGFGLLERCRTLAENLLPGAAIRVVEQTGPDTPDLDGDPEQVRWHSLYDHIRPGLDQEDPGPDNRLLLLCPSAGVVSRSLLTRMLDQMPNTGQGPVLASADPLHHNAHPCWIMHAEGRYDSEKRTYERDSSFLYLLNVVEYEENLCDGQEPLPKPTQVKGSHLLPKLMLTTEAVVLAPCLVALDLARSGGEVEHVAATDCPDAPLVYNQPLFTMTL